MSSFFKLFVNKVTGKSSHTRVSHIEGAERVCVDSSVLCCPVCYEVYSSVPSLLGCGHTFCGRCVRTMQVNRMVEETAKDSVIDCPLCRVSISSNEVFKNYLVDDLLRSVEEIGERESKKNGAPTSEIVATLRLAKDRSEKKVAHLELRNSNLDRELQATKKQLRLMNLIIFSAVMGYLALELFIGLINLLSLSLSGDWLARMAVDSKIDRGFRNALILSKLFTKSWGRATTLKELYLFKKECTSQRLMPNFVQEFRPKIAVTKENRSNGVYFGQFDTVSPYSMRFPGHCPNPIGRCPFALIMPERGAERVCIHLAGTGDHGFWRREKYLASPLLDKGTASILLCNPFYGERRPKHQRRSSLHNVSDLFVMGASLISECLFILNWAKETYGFKHVAVSGVSMGGFMASLAVSNIPYPVGCVPLLSAVSAGPSYTKGVLSEAILWDVLDKELRDRDYVRKLEEIPGCDWIHRAHQNTASNNESLSRNFMKILMEEFTHLGTYPTPVFPQATVALSARSDGYIMHDGLEMQDELWKGSEMRYIDRGHVTTYVFCQDVFRECILQSFEKLEQRPAPHS